MLPAEAALDAEMAAGHRVIRRRCDLHDGIVLHVEFQVAANATEGTHGCGHLLDVLIPRAGLAHVELGPEDQGTGGTHADAVAAVDAGRIGQGHV